jgi:hypothetical protein
VRTESPRELVNEVSGDTQPAITARVQIRLVMRERIREPDGGVADGFDDLHFGSFVLAVDGRGRV